jgi:hypothetical protein
MSVPVSRATCEASRRFRHRRNSPRGARRLRFLPDPSDFRGPRVVELDDRARAIDRLPPKGANAVSQISKAFLIAILVAAPCLGSGCQSPQPAPSVAEAPRETIECVDPRPELCTQDYRPVCGLRDTGIRCVTTPCDSTEWKTYSNGCTACSDPDVERYRPGACGEDA